MQILENPPSESVATAVENPTVSPKAAALKELEADKKTDKQAALEEEKQKQLREMAEKARQLARVVVQGENEPATAKADRLNSFADELLNQSNKVDLGVSTLIDLGAVSFHNKEEKAANERIKNRVGASKWKAKSPAGTTKQVPDEASLGIFKIKPEKPVLLDSAKPKQGASPTDKTFSERKTQLNREDSIEQSVHNDSLRKESHERIVEALGKVEVTDEITSVTLAIVDSGNPYALSNWASALETLAAHGEMKDAAESHDEYIAAA